MMFVPTNDSFFIHKYTTVFLKNNFGKFGLNIFNAYGNKLPMGLYFNSNRNNLIRHLLPFVFVYVRKRERILNVIQLKKIIT